MIIVQQTVSAYHALRAAQNRRNWGPWPARLYCINRGVTPSLYRLARQLDAMSRNEV